MILTLFSVMFLMTSSIKASPDIVYKISDAYELIWNDLESEGDHDGSIWRAKNYQNEFCSIGDVAARGYESPLFKAILVSAKKSGAVKQPAGFTKIWTDRGSGAKLSVAIYRMNAPSGYTCLGHVAVGGGSPDASKYCCIKNEYVVQADTVQVYNDAGTGSDADGSLWTTIRKGGEAFGIEGGNFISVVGYSKPRTAYLLKQSEKVQDIWSLSAGEIKPLNLYEMNQLKKIWTDAGSGADADCSIWRAEIKPDYYPIGDIVVATHAKPRIGFLIRVSDKKGDAIRPPVSYSRIWNDAGSEADSDVHLWKPSCAGGYVALGNVATNGALSKVGDIYCIKSTYTIYGSSANWQRTWTDAGSGADRDVGIYEAISKSSNQQTVRGFGAVASHRSLPPSPYLLNKNFVTYHAEKPIEKMYMYNVQYDLSGEQHQTKPVTLYSTDVINPSSGDSLTRRTITFSITESSSFTFSQAITIGIAVEITAGVPLIGAGQKTTISASTTSTFTTGSTTSKTYTDSILSLIHI